MDELFRQLRHLRRPFFVVKAVASAGISASLAFVMCWAVAVAGQRGVGTMWLNPNPELGLGPVASRHYFDFLTHAPQQHVTREA